MWKWKGRLGALSSEKDFTTLRLLDLRGRDGMQLLGRSFLNFSLALLLSRSWGMSINDS